MVAVHERPRYRPALPDHIGRGDHKRSTIATVSTDEIVTSSLVERSQLRRNDEGQAVALGDSGPHVAQNVKVRLCFSAVDNDSSGTCGEIATSRALRALNSMMFA